MLRIPKVISLTQTSLMNSGLICMMPTDTYTYTNFITYVLHTHTCVYSTYPKPNSGLSLLPHQHSPSIAFPISIDGHSILQVVNLDFSHSLTFHNHTISKLYWLCLQKYVQNLANFSASPLLLSWQNLHQLYPCSTLHYSLFSHF